MKEETRSGSKGMDTTAKDSGGEKRQVSGTQLVIMKVY
jgi:hypothetical protein